MLDSSHPTLDDGPKCLTANDVPRWVEATKETIGTSNKNLCRYCTYPLENIQKTMEISPMFHGTIHYKLDMFHSCLYVYQRVSVDHDGHYTTPGDDHDPASVC